MARDDDETLTFASQADWRGWLGEHHATSRGVRLQLARKGGKVSGLTHPEALEEALRHGWIDGRADGGDADYFGLRFSPRAVRSKWSKVNTVKAEALIAAGRMTPAGLAEVERAKADGRWAAAYDPPSTVETPAALTAALAANPKAKAAYEGLDSRNRYAILHRLQTAKKDETKAKRLADFVAMLARGEVIHPPIQRRS